MARKIYNKSSTGQFQKETGDRIIFANENGKTVAAVNVINVLGTGNWNVVLLAQDGKYVNKKVLKSTTNKSVAIKFAKAYVRKH